MSLPSNVREIWTDMYKLHDKFNDMGNTVDEWTIWWRTATSILHKHGDCRLVTDLMYAISAYLEEERRGKLADAAPETPPDHPSGPDPIQQSLF